jgi:hypothetical protein
MGIMLLVLAPIPYVDATAAGAFRSKWSRALVGAAGILVELFLAGIAMFVWVLVEPGLLRSIAFNVLLVAGASTLLFNGNPLLRYDGYYVLADLIEIPNLGNRSNQYWQWLAKRYLFGLKSIERPPASVGERRWFVFYGAASFIYRTLVMIAITLFIAGEFFVVGVVLALWAAITMFALPIGKGLAYVLSSPELQRVRTRARLLTFGALALFLLFVLAVPMPLRTHAEGVVWVPENAEVRAAADGFVERLLVPPEASVGSGDLLLVTVDPTLSAEVEQSRARLRQFEVQYASLMFERACPGCGDSGGSAAGTCGAGACRRETRRAAGGRRRARRAQAGAGAGSAGALREAGRTARLYSVDTAALVAGGGHPGRHRAGARAACRGRGQDRRPHRADLAGTRPSRSPRRARPACRARRCRSPAAARTAPIRAIPTD